MQTDELSLTLESNDFSCDRLRVHTFAGREVISRLFEYDLEIVCLDHDGPSVEVMTGASITLVIERASSSRAGWHGVRRLHGVVAEVDDLLAGHADIRVYRLRVVPHAYALALVETQDIFMGATVPELIQRKLAAVGLGDNNALRLSSTYVAREFVVQYKETDLAFVSRLAEHLGISFFFEHGDDTETIVFTDHTSGFARDGDRAPFPFRARGEEKDVFALAVKRRMIPSYYAVRDYNYRTPAVDLTAEHSLDDASPGGVIEFGGHHKTPDEGLALARVRAEERQSTQVVYTGRSAIPELGAGLRFTLDGHPDLGSIELLVTEVEHRAMQVVAGMGIEGGKPGYTLTDPLVCFLLRESMAA